MYRHNNKITTEYYILGFITVYFFMLFGYLLRKNDNVCIKNNIYIHRIMSSLLEVFDQIDNAKQKLTEQEYINICNLLKICYEEQCTESSFKFISKHIQNMSLTDLENIQDLIKSRKKMLKRSVNHGFVIGQQVKILSLSMGVPDRIGTIFRLHKDSIDVKLQYSIVRRIDFEDIEAI